MEERRGEVGEAIGKGLIKPREVEEAWERARG